jgi:hypothetical protein
MPIERQARAPLTRRDKQLIATLCAAVLAGAVAIVIAIATRSPRSNTGCVQVTLPSTMGGATIRRCGTAARVFCHEQRSIAVVAAACRRDGYRDELMKTTAT